MAGEWKTHRVGDIAAAMGDAPFGSLIKNHDYTDSGALVVQGKNIQGRTCDWSDRRYVSHEKYQSLRRSHCMAGDLLFPKVGTIGKVGILTACPGVDEYVLSTNTMRFRADPKVATADYVYYFFTWSETVNLIHALNSNSVQPVFNFTSLKNFKIPLPPLAEQKAIAAVLGALDDLIELNRETNEILEEMARALFKSWFVDFDPVRAKLEGRPPAGMNAATAALFPDHFQDSELGQIPKGWENATIGEICEINSWTLGKSDKLESLEYVEISEVNRGNIANMATYQRGDEPSRARRRLRHGDTVLSTVRPDRGAYFLALNPPANRVASTGFAVLTPSKVPWSFVHAAMTQPEISDHLGHLADGGAYPAVRPEIISGIEVVIPNTSAILDAFQQVCAPLFEVAESNRLESRDLATLRDTLLPKLLSGEITPTTLSA